MKTKIVLLSFFAVLLVTACEKPTPPNGDPTDPIDTTSLSYYLAGEWECVTIVNPYDLYDTAVITLTFYPIEKKIYQTMVRLDSTLGHYSWILFNHNDIWSYYDLREDTLYYQQSDGDFHFDDGADYSYTIYRPSQDTMAMIYRGALPANMVRGYLFIRKK